MRLGAKSEPLTEMAAKIIQFKRPDRPVSQLDPVIQDVQMAYVAIMGRRLPDHLARMLAEAIESAPPKRR